MSSEKACAKKLVIHLFVWFSSNRFLTKPNIQIGISVSPILIFLQLNMQEISPGSGIFN